MLVRLNVLFPQFCISLVSGPEGEEHRQEGVGRSGSQDVTRTPTAPTCEQHQAEAPLGVPQGAAAQQDLLVVQRVLLAAEDQRPREAVKTVVGGFAAHLTCGEDGRSFRREELPLPRLLGLCVPGGNLL